MMPPETLVTTPTAMKTGRITSYPLLCVCVVGTASAQHKLIGVLAVSDDTT